MVAKLQDGNPGKAPPYCPCRKNAPAKFVKTIRLKISGRRDRCENRGAMPTSSESHAAWSPSTQEAKQVRAEEDVSVCRNCQTHGGHKDDICLMQDTHDLNAPRNFSNTDSQGGSQRLSSH